MQQTTETSGRTEATTFSDVELDAWRGFLRTHSTLLRELDDELTRMHGLPVSSYDVLVQLDEAAEGRLRMSALADAVLLSRSGLSRLVTRLEGQGLIERVECASDARGSFAAITDKGRERLDQARVTHRAGVRARFFDHLGERELRQLAKVWSRVLDDPS